MSKENKGPADRNDPLLRELENEVRREQYAKLWEKYGVYLVGAAAAVILAVGAYQIWDWNRRTAAETAGAAYEAAAHALADGKSGDALKSLEALAGSAPGGYSALARLQLAGAYAKAGRMAEAVGAYEALAGDTGADPLLRDFARLQAAYARVGEGDWAEMEARLNELLSAGSPFYAAARELWGIAALEAGKVDEARDTFAQLLADKGTPAGTRERVSSWLSTLVGSEGAKPGEKAAETTPEPAVTSAGQPGGSTAK